MKTEETIGKAKQSLFCILSGLFLIGLLGTATTSMAAEGVWEMKADMPTARWGLATCVVDGIIYAFGGAVNPNNPLATVEAYDPATDTWTQKADMPTPKYFTSASVVDGRIYVIGGIQREMGTALSEVHEYDPATDTWTIHTDIPTRRAAHTAGVVNGIIYVIGGLPGGDNIITTVEAYDPATDTWTTKANMPSKRACLGCSVVDQKIYAIGGTKDHWINVKTVEEYDPATDTWTTKTGLPEDRACFETSVVDGIIYAVGGGPSYETWSYASVEAYDPQADSWTAKAEMSIARTALSTSVVNGKIYAIGGTSSIHTLAKTYATVEEYDPNPLVVDFNGDGKVDIKDLLRLIESWGKDDPIVDIGPTGFGDGVVDVADLEVLMGYWEQEVDDPTLVAHWALDETEGVVAHDRAGDNDGAVTGIPLWQPDVGKIGGALEFNGTFFVVADFVLNPSDGPFSVLAWVKDGTARQAIISQVGGANWLMVDASGTLMTELKSIGRFGTPLFSDTVVTDGDWHRIGFTWDGSTRSLYVDDVLVAQDTDTGLADGHGGLSIGCGNTMAPDTFFTGLIDDVRIYNRAVKP